MSNFKEEVFLIKGHYYTFSQNYIAIPLTNYGAIEGGITIDSTDRIGKFDGFAADVLIKKHGDKWGVFKSVSINGMGCVDWATDDDNPFVYDDYQIASNGYFGDDPDGYETFLLLKKKGQWKAFRLIRGETTPICLQEEDGLVFKSKIVIKKRLEDKYNIKLRCQEKCDYNDSENSSEFDDDKDFMKRYSLRGEHRFISMVLGLESYLPDMSLILAAAHKNVYATVLIGKYLISEYKQNAKVSDTNLNDYEKKLLDTCIDYFTLGKQYADLTNNKTMSDIAMVFWEKARALKVFGLKM